MSLTTNLNQNQNTARVGQTQAVCRFWIWFCMLRFHRVVDKNNWVIVRFCSFFGSFRHFPKVCVLLKCAMFFSKSVCSFLKCSTVRILRSVVHNEIAVRDPTIAGHDVVDSGDRIRCAARCVAPRFCRERVRFL